MGAVGAVSSLHMLARASTADGVSAGWSWDNFAAPVTAQRTVVHSRCTNSLRTLGLPVACHVVF